MLDYFINERLNQLVLSNPAEKDHLQKVKVRPILIRGALVFQAEEFTKTQAFHKNLGAQELKSYSRISCQSWIRPGKMSSSILDAESPT